MKEERIAGGSKRQSEEKKPTIYIPWKLNEKKMNLLTWLQEVKTNSAATQSYEFPGQENASVHDLFGGKLTSFIH